MLNANIINILKSLTLLQLCQLMSSIILTVTVVKLAKNQNSSLWVFAALIGEGFTEPKKIIPAVIIWLFAGILIKELLCSELVSSLTAQTKPSNIPDSFYELVNNSSMTCIASNILCRWFAFQAETHYGQNLTRQYEFHKKAFERVRRVDLREDWCKYFKNEKLNIQLKRDTIKMSSAYYPETESQKTEAILRNFIMFYQTTPSKLYGSVTSAVPIVALCGKHRLFKNYYADLFVKINHWHFNERSYIQNWFENNLAAFVASGIWEKMISNYKHKLLFSNLQHSIHLKTVVSKRSVSQAARWMINSVWGKQNAEIGVDDSQSKNLVSLKGLYGTLFPIITLIFIAAVIFCFERLHFVIYQNN